MEGVNGVILLIFTIGSYLAMLSGKKHSLIFMKIFKTSHAKMKITKLKFVDLLSRSPPDRIVLNRLNYKSIPFFITS